MFSVRYIVDDVDAAIEFYRECLGFSVDMHPAPGFAALSKAELRLLLNAPGAGGAGQAGGDPKPGGWNRFQIEVEDLDTLIEQLSTHGVNFRGELVEGEKRPRKGDSPGAAAKSWPKTHPATRSNCSSRLGELDSQQSAGFAIVHLFGHE